MRFNIHFRKGIQDRLHDLADEMRAWEANHALEDAEKQNILEAIVPFNHTTTVESLCIGGVDGSGDFPSLGYADSFVYVTVAEATVYRSDPVVKLKEEEPAFAPLLEFTWIPEEAAHRRQAWDKAFEALSGMAMEEVISGSDYRHLKDVETRRSHTVSALVEGLVRPHAADSGNVAIQLRSTGELGMALRLIRNHPNLNLVLLDGTFSLPLVTRKEVSLFYEHLKRLCCVEARKRNIGLFALSKSHGLPGLDVFEEVVRDKFGANKGAVPEHWFFRLPVPGHDSWRFSLAEGRRIPHAGTVSYLVRFHKNSPIFRLDMDREYWNALIRGNTAEETFCNEQHIFELLDYSCHDQRCYGYPYPIKAGHDRASLTREEREVLRKQITEAAVKAGLKRSLFRSASKATGHE